MGRAFRYQRRLSHILVSVAERQQTSSQGSEAAVVVAQKPGKKTAAKKTSTQKAAATKTAAKKAPAKKSAAKK